MLFNYCNTLLICKSSLQFDPRESIAFPDMSYLSNESAVIPPSFANVFPEQPAAQEPQEPQVASFAMKGSLWNSQASGKYLFLVHCNYCENVWPPLESPPAPPTQNVSGTDPAAQFQFPVDDDEENQPGKHNPDSNRQPPTSALRKSSSSGKKTPVFNER